jgi:hypothetical protein
MVAAAVRKGTESKTVFYDFDFAIAPKTCSREMEMLTGSCMYEKVRRRHAVSPAAPATPAAWGWDGHGCAC